MLPSYFDYIFVHLKQQVRLRPEISTKVLSTLGPNPARTQTGPEKPGPTHNSELQFVRWPVSTGTCNFFFHAIKLNLFIILAVLR